MSKVNPIEHSGLLPSVAADGTVSQLLRIVKSRFPELKVAVSASGRSFHGTRPGDSTGVRSCHAELKDDVVSVKLELLPPSTGTTLPLTALASLEEISKDRRIVTRRDDRDADLVSLWLELVVDARPLTVTRENVFLQELERADEVARILQAELPGSLDKEALTKLYENLAAVLAPVYPGRLDDVQPILDLTREVMDYVRGSCSVAVAAPYQILSSYCISALALAAKEHGRTIGVLTAPAINAKSLLDLAKDAPGTVIVPADRMRLGISQYELGGEMQPLLSSLSENGTPVIFTGDLGQLQTVFHGGQGGACDPLRPIVRMVPEVVPLDHVVRFAVRAAARGRKGISQRVEGELTAQTFDAVQGYQPAEQMRILSTVATRVVDGYERGTQQDAPTSAAFAARVSGLKQTLAGLPSRPRVSRAVCVQERYLQVLPTLLTFLQERIVGQDEAIVQVADRLCAESLTRPLHQPLRYCAQGLPGTGKSLSATLLAELLDVPYVYIDAPSMPDFYTAAAQLLGGGRGLVGSHQAGRLEQAAKHNAGAVLEIADLDHALPTVRHAVADLFLQVLETGEGQSGTGALFSCANLVFAFTMNLPDGQDEAVRQKMGFHDSVSETELTVRVSDEIKRCLSGAFLSRVGTPILFGPLDETALATIATRAVKSAVQCAAERTGVTLGNIVVDDDLGVKLVASLKSNMALFGARGLFEHCRSLVARSVLETPVNSGASTEMAVRVSWRPEGSLRITAIETLEGAS